jgi:hypothetical protein
LAVALISFFTALPVRASEKTGTLVLHNGNEITGEVKGLDQGQLTYSTDDLGILSVAWGSAERAKADPRADAFLSI